jgi:CheY-like chemotaxis protein
MQANHADKDVTLLLVDDDDVDVMGIKRALKKLQITNPVVRARDGIEGLAKLRECSDSHKPYLVLLDLNLPRMNGLEVLAEIRKDPELASAVVFVLTTSKAEEDKAIAYKHNIAGYIIKSQVGDGVVRAMEMLRGYWRVVELIV